MSMDSPLATPQGVRVKAGLITMRQGLWEYRVASGTILLPVSTNREGLADEVYELCIVQRGHSVLDNFSRYPQIVHG
jgi:hypothetical protein